MLSWHLRCHPQLLRRPCWWGHFELGLDSINWNEQFSVWKSLSENDAGPAGLITWFVNFLSGCPLTLVSAQRNLGSTMSKTDKEEELLLLYMKSHALGR